MFACEVRKVKMLRQVFCWIVVLGIGTCWNDSNFGSGDSVYLDEENENIILNLSSNVVLNCKGNNVTWMIPNVGRSNWIERNVSRLTKSGNGSLILKDFKFQDSGYYTCSGKKASDKSEKNEFNKTYLLLKDASLRKQFEINSIILAFITSAVGIAVGLLIGFIKLFIQRCCCCFSCQEKDKIASGKSDQLRQYLTTFEKNRLDQLERLRDNYASQKQRIAESYNDQVAKIMDNYQVRRERFRDYRADAIERIRDNCSQQILRIRGYSQHQLGKLHGNYSLQMTRVRQFSWYQLENIRHQYELKRKHVKNIVDELPWPTVCRTNVEHGDADFSSLEDIHHLNVNLIELDQVHDLSKDTDQPESLIAVPSESRRPSAKGDAEFVCNKENINISIVKRSDRVLLKTVDYKGFLHRSKTYSTESRGANRMKPSVNSISGFRNFRNVYKKANGNLKPNASKSNILKVIIEPVPRNLIDTTPNITDELFPPSLDYFTPESSLHNYSSCDVTSNGDTFMSSHIINIPSDSDRIPPV